MTSVLEGGTETGYAHPDYAISLSEFGRARSLIQSGGWVLERHIPGIDASDAMGCYPIFSCRNWSLLDQDLNDAGDDLVSLVLVADPFGSYTTEILRSTFRDLVIPYKDHFIADLQHPAKSFVSKHHHYYARKALTTVNVELCPEPAQMLDEWSKLYHHLVTRHQLSGIKAFSRAAFAKQLNVPGLVMFRASHEGETVGAHLWYMQGDVASSHLVAANASGYELMSAYALSWSAIEYFTGKVRWINWGAGAGLNAEGKDGLTRYKKGWATGTRPVYLCGRVLNRAKYEEISRARGLAGSHYFPCYREGELG